jgi:O-antigen ligase/Flp pilus assembly protein TadD
VAGGLVLLIIATPMCFGAAQPWAFRTAETAIFAMFGAAIMRMRAVDPAVNGGAAVFAVAWPAGAVALLLGFQLIPLPPAMVSALSPEAYVIYRHTLNGWPSRVDYPPPAPAVSVLPPVGGDARSRPAAPAPGAQVKNGAPVRLTSAGDDSSRAAPAVAGWRAAVARWYGGRWRPLSLAPTLGVTKVLLVAGAFTLFALVALYPVGGRERQGDEDPLTRLLIGAILLSGVAVAIVGLVEQATWNGKVLWFLVPRDWRAVRPGFGRAIGPFVDPDHFAAYLAMTAPLLMARALGGYAARDRRSRTETVPILCSAALVVVACGILLSQSRAVWGGLVVSFLLFGVLVSRVQTPQAFRIGPERTRAWPLRLGIAGLAIAVAAIVLIGSGGRGQVSARVGNTLGGGLDLPNRISLWRATLGMFRDFPLVGVGLGSWPEVFVHYESGPWPLQFYRHAHNDYVELAAELGVFGLAAVALVVWRFAGFVRKRWNRVAPRARVTLAALVAGMAVEGFHELFDFSLTMPAIGFLFAIYAGLAVRIAAAGAPESESDHRARRHIRIAGPYAAALAGVFAFASVVQSGTIYPFYPPARTFDEARETLLLHPAYPYSHLQMALWYWRSPRAVTELAAAVWLDPRNPYMHDVYAHRLAAYDRMSEALDQITLSVMWAPDFGSHSYLSPQVIPHLDAGDRKAIELGLSEAVARGYAGAVESLGAFYEGTGRTLDAAQTYARGAKTEPDPRRRAQLLLSAGQAYARAGQLDQARRNFIAARALRPADPDAYVALLSQVFAPRKDMAGAESVLDQGLDAGADPIVLLGTFAQAAETAGQPDKARAALIKMVEYEPTYSNFLRLGWFYLAAREYDRASATFRRATEIEPLRPQAWLELATAEENAYQYAAADRDYLRACKLAPNDNQARERYAAFQKKLAAGRPNAAPPAPAADTTYR